MYANDTSRALHAAVSGGKLRAVMEMLANGADVDGADCWQVRPVHIAAEQGHLDILKALIARGCNVNARAFGSITLSKEIDDGLMQVRSAVGNNDPFMAFAVEQMLGTGISFASFIFSEMGLMMTPLHYAARYGHLSAVEALVNANANVNDANNSFKFTPLLMALKWNFEDIAKFLIQSGAVVNTRDFERSSPLHFVAENGNLNVTKLLIRNGAAINAKNQKGFTPLHVAIRNKQPAVSQFLIDSGADVNARNKKGRTPLLYAAKSQYPAEAVRHLIAKGASVNVRDTIGRTPLHFAVDSGLIGVVNTLIENKADVNVTDSQKWTPLHRAACAGNLDAIKALIAKGAEFAAVTHMQATPLHFAAASCHVEVVKYLLAKGANVNATDHINWTPLHFAAGDNSARVPSKLSGHSAAQSKDAKLNTIKVLIEKGSDVNAKGSNDETALYLAAKCDDQIVARCLLENGAYFDAKPRSFFCNSGPTICAIGENVNALLRATEKLFQAVKGAKCAEISKCVREGAPVNSRSMKYETPLMYASWKGHLAVVNVLLENGADTNLCNRNGVTPLHYAAKFGHHEILCVLLQHGALYNAETKKGKKTPLHFAQEEGKIEVAETLKLIESVFDRLSKKDTTLQKLKHIKNAEFLALKNCKTVNNESLVHIASENGYDALCKLFCDL